MKVTATSLVVLFAAAASFCSAAALPSNRDAHGNSLIARDADDDDNPAENHDPNVIAPPGAVVRTVPVPIGTTASRILTYWTQKPSNDQARHAYIVIHGRFLDGDRYWSVMNAALQSAIRDYKPSNGDGKPDENAIIVAPEFFSAKLNSGRYKGSQMAWGTEDTYQAGGVAIAPAGNTASAFDALDALVSHFADRQHYPLLRNITIVSHGGGAQLTQRYASVGKQPPAGVWVRYIHGDASTNAYFTSDRPIIEHVSNATKKKCTEYHDWKYGFKGYKGTEGLTARQYFHRYITRDVISLVGLKDILPNGDQTCAAQLQGGPARRDRNMAWYKYITALAGTGEDVSSLNGSFDLAALPQWGKDNGFKSALRLMLVKGAGHDAEEVLGSEQGRSALFNKHIPSWHV